MYPGTRSVLHAECYSEHSVIVELAGRLSLDRLDATTCTESLGYEYDALRFVPGQDAGKAGHHRCSFKMNTLEP